MKFTVVTLFPEFFESPLKCGLLGRAHEKGLVRTKIVNLRDYAVTKYRHCDDAPFGGGSGMVMSPVPLFKCLDENEGDEYTILLTPSGEPFTQDLVKELGSKKSIRMICGHYEGVDERVSQKYVNKEISIGDYVVSGGEYGALVIIDSVSRYVPGFMGNAESLTEESFEDGLLEYPHYTRPSEIEGMAVPEVLLSGNHAEIKKWRHQKRIEKTMKVRPDLYKRFSDDKRGDDNERRS